MGTLNYCVTPLTRVEKLLNATSLELWFGFAFYVNMQFMLTGFSLNHHVHVCVWLGGGGGGGGGGEGGVGGRVHIDFGGDPVGICVASCLHSIS